jgi:hypothetical protein
MLVTAVAFSCGHSKRKGDLVGRLLLLVLQALTAQIKSLRFITSKIAHFHVLVSRASAIGFMWFAH